MFTNSLILLTKVVISKTIQQLVKQSVETIDKQLENYIKQLEKRGD